MAARGARAAADDSARRRAHADQSDDADVTARVRHAAKACSEIGLDRGPNVADRIPRGAAGFPIALPTWSAELLAAASRCHRRVRAPVLRLPQERRRLSRSSSCRPPIRSNRPCHQPEPSRRQYDWRERMSQRVCTPKRVELLQELVPGRRRFDWFSQTRKSLGRLALRKMCKQLGDDRWDVKLIDSFRRVNYRPRSNDPSDLARSIEGCSIVDVLFSTSAAFTGRCRKSSPWAPDTAAGDLSLRDFAESRRAD